MKQRSKRPEAVLLAAILVLSLAACDSRGKEVHKVNWVTAPAYLAEDVALPVQTGDLIGCCTDGEYMYILADEKAESGEVRSTLARVYLANGTAEVLDGYQATVVPDGGFKNTLGPVLAPDGTMWLYEMWTISYYDLPEDFDPEKEPMGQYYTGREDFHHLRQLDPATGRQKDLIDLSDAVRTLDISEIFDVAGFVVDGGGNIYFAGTGGVAALDKNGNYLFTLEASLPYGSVHNTSGSSLALLPDGTPAVLTILPGGKRAVRTIDAAAKGWGGERYELPVGVDLIYGGTNGFLFYYTTGGALWAWEPEAEEGRTLLSWAAAELSGAVMCFAPQDNGKLSVLTLTQSGASSDDDYWYKADIRLSMLSPTDKSPSDGKTKLVYGTIGTDSVLRSRINQFNSGNDRYYIELRNYAGEGVEAFDLDSATREAAQKLLSAEVASGRAPDIWDASLPLDLYARKGMLEDLWPYIDSDPEISRDTLMSHVLDCASVDGKLYKVFNSFSIRTAAARSEVVGGRTGWTLEEMLDCYADMPEGSTILGTFQGKLWTLQDLVSYNYEEWIDWTTGECRFDSEDFKALLELSSRAEDKLSTEVDQEDWNRLANGADVRAGRQLMLSVVLEGMADILCCEAMMGGPQCLTDYEAYLNANNIFDARVDDDGNWRDDSVLVCQALSRAASYRFRGRAGGNTLSPDAVFGAVEGGGYVSYVGFPSASGMGSCFELPDAGSLTGSTLGISAVCRDKEGAWAYARQYLLPGSSSTVQLDGMYYVSFGFPINREDFNALLEPKWFQREDGEYVLDQDGGRIEEPQDVCAVPAHFMNMESSMVVYQLAPNELQMERFWDLYNAINCVGGAESEVWKIIREQAEIYFAGDKSLDETADLIQRRATLYVNENR